MAPSGQALRISWRVIMPSEFSKSCFEQGPGSIEIRFDGLAQAEVIGAVSYVSIKGQSFTATLRQ
jgi:hypothetical protein